MYKITDENGLLWYDKVGADFPAAKTECSELKEISLAMTDHVQLNTRIFLPKSKAPYNVLFVRNPYPANEGLYEGLYLPLVEQGYCLIIQDCRGTGKSQGLWQPFENERQDGIDSLNWLQAQEWVKGVATFGRSYSAFTQWIVADKLPEKVKTMFLEVYGVNRFDQVYTNGVFREDIYTSWAFANSGVQSKIAPSQAYRLAIKQSPANQRDINILKQRLPFYQDYLRETDPKSVYWQNSIWKILAEVPEKINVPVVVIDGWADHHLQGSLMGYNHLRPDIRKQSRLIITPTDHIGNVTGDLKYEHADHFGFMNMRANLDWFNYIFEKKTHIFQSSMYLMRADRWEELTDSSQSSTKLYLTGSGGLADQPETDKIMRFVYNPIHPNTWPGGNELLAWIAPEYTDLPHGFTKTAPYPNKADVIRFGSRVFDTAQKILGEIKVQLRVASNCPDTAFAVRLCEQTADQQYINIKDGISSISGSLPKKSDNYLPGQQIVLNISLGNIAWELQAGSSLILLISSSNFPMYAVHSNKRGLWSQQVLENISANQSVYTGQAGSYLELPIA